MKVRLDMFTEKSPNWTQKDWSDGNDIEELSEYNSEIVTNINFETQNYFKYFPFEM